MNMTVLVWPEWSSEVPDVSDDDPARRITFFKKEGAWRGSYKCPNQQWKPLFEYGFHHGSIIIENPVDHLQTRVCNTLVKLLEQSNNRSRLVENILNSKQK